MLTGALKEAEKCATDASSLVEEAQLMVEEKEEFLKSAKERYQMLKGECAAAHADLEKTKQAEVKAFQAAKTAQENAERNRRKTQE